MPIGSLLGGLASGAASIFGSSNSADAAKQAAQIQANAANRATDLQQAVYQQIQQNLGPFQGSGQNAISNLYGLLNTQPGSSTNLPGILRNPATDLGPPPQWNMPAFTSQMYQASPGYASALQGGTQALQNAGAGRGGALSGNVLQAIQGQGSQLANQDFNTERANYQTNYANQYGADTNRYLNQYTQQNQQNTNIFQWLDQLLGQGQSAAAGLGGLGQTAASNAGNAIIGAGNAQAAGTIGAANAQAGGLNSLATLLSGPNSPASSLSSLFGNIFGGGSGGGGSFVDYGSGAGYGGGADFAAA